ncbi:MAG: hypothetical protein RI910_1889 [Verrucomicrobiota bacterium]
MAFVAEEGVRKGVRRKQHQFEAARATVVAGQLTEDQSLDDAAGRVEPKLDFLGPALGLALTHGAQLA